VEEDPSRKHFFTDIINSVSSAKYDPLDENLIYSRDYLAMHIWDVRNTKMPCRTYNVNDYLEKKLCDLYENESVFDRFSMQVSNVSKLVLTGSYNGSIHVIDTVNNSNTTIDIRFLDKRGKNAGVVRKYKGKRVQGSLMN
jgi:serine/threonine-protein phosphatase 2A regulatory subunit B